MERKATRARVVYLEASTGGVLGGSLTGLQHLLRGLDRRCYEPIVILYEAKAIQGELDRDGIPVVIFRKYKRGRVHPLQKVRSYQSFRSRRTVGRLLRHAREIRLFIEETLPAAYSLARLFKKHKPDLVHLCNGLRANLDAIVAARLAGVPCVCHVKGFENYGWIDRFFAPWVELGICMTKAVHDYCERHKVHAKRMTIVYDGLDVNGFQPARDSSAIRSELGIPVDVPLVGVLGHIQAWKGQAVVVEAIEELRHIVADIRCLVVGGVHRNGAEYFQEIRRFVDEHELQENVIFTGARDDVADLVAAMDVVVHSSVRPEPFGRVILEAMALAKPVIATNLGGVPEMVQDGITGRLVPPNDRHALATAIVELLGNAGQRERLGNNGWKEVRCRFTIQHHVRAVTDCYAQLGV